jgi:peptidoglycan hydrolase-like protein with peptidoglycan-binding domain
MDVEQVSKRKVLGVPMLYLIGGFVLILAVLAWRMKSAPTGPAADATATDATTTDGTTGGTIGGDVYPNMPTGTVISAPTTPSPADAPYEDNSTWMRKSVAWLIEHGENPGTAQTALQHYLAGGNLTYDEGAIRDKAVRQFGLPPDIADAGTTGAKPATATTPAPTTRGDGFYRTTGTGSRPVWRKDASGLHYVSLAVYTARGKPAITDVAAGDQLWKLPRGADDTFVPVIARAAPPRVIAKPAPPKPAAPAPYHPAYPGQNGGGAAGAKAIQKRVGVTVDGIYGPKTRAAVVAFQRSHGLAADGIVGPLTWRKMFG